MNKQLKSLKDSIHDFMGLDLTDEQLLGFLSTKKSLLNDIEEIGYDTCNREATMSLIGKKLVGRECPTYGDGKSVSDLFYKELYEAAKKNGIKIVGEE